MVNDFIPAPDGQFTGWAQNLVDVISVDPTKYGLSPEAIAELEANVTAWESKYGNSIEQKDAAKAAVAEKDLERDKLNGLIRNLARQIQADPEVTDASKLAAGLPVHSTSRTPVPVPSSAPLAAIESNQIRQHVIRLMDNENPHRRSRPRGVMVCEFLCYVGPNHPTEQDFKTVALATRMTETVNFAAADSGQMAWYQFRWINTRGEKGPFSPIYNALVT